jgi:biotin carboxyl carrier protein
VKYYRIRVDGVEYRVGVEKIEEGVYRIKLGDKEAEVFVEESYERGMERIYRQETEEEPVIIEKVSEKVEKIEAEEGIVTAMLPGVVVKILVAPGDRVGVGDPIMIVESMKMENEIVSPIEGTVREIRVKEGQRIEAGDVLAVIG